MNYIAGNLINDVNFKVFEFNFCHVLRFRFRLLQDVIELNVKHTKKVKSQQTKLLNIAKYQMRLLFALLLNFPQSSNFHRIFILQF